MMKRCFWMLLLAILLVGCAENVEPDTIPTTTVQETTIPPETSCYVEESELEKSSGGAVRVYDLPEDEYNWMRVNGDTLLFGSAAEEGKLVQGTGEGGSFFLDEQVFPKLANLTCYDTTAAGAVFYDSQSGTATFLRPGLQEYVLELGELGGQPVFSPDGNRLYYCAGNEIWVMDLSTGIKRMLKSHSCQEQSIEGLYFDGSVIGCRILQSDGTQTLAFIASETGQTLAQEENVSNIVTWGQRFILDYPDGIVDQRLFGSREGVPQCLRLPEADYELPILEWNSVLTYDVDDLETISFKLYDLETGKLCGKTELKGTLKSLCVSNSGKSLWLLITDSDTGEDMLYQWLPELSAVRDDNNYVTPYYTAQSPDTESLENFKEIAAQMAEQYGVKVYIWDDAVQNPGEYVLEGEYQTLAIADAIVALDKTLASYPQEFLYKLANRYLNICIVRSISTGTDSVHYLLDGDFYIVLRVGCDFDAAFASALGYLVDIHTLGNTSALDDWSSLNPEGFAYGQEPDEALLEGQTRAFADAQCMASVTDDRSRTFYYAMLPGNEELFQSEIMQNKLTKLCLGIRAAWKWKKVTDIFPWEQYLNEPVAPAEN